MTSERYYPPRRKYSPDTDTTLWWLKIMRDANRRRNGKEYEASKRVSAALLSDKISDDNFCKNILPKLIDNHASLVEENVKKFQAELKELNDYLLWYFTPEKWSYAI